MNTIDQLATLLLRSHMSARVQCEVRDRYRIDGARHLPPGRLFLKPSLLLVVGALIAGFASQAGATFVARPHKLIAARASSTPVRIAGHRSRASRTAATPAANAAK